MTILQPFAIPKNGELNERVEHMLHAVRRHLGMDIGFVSEFKEGKRFFRHVDADTSNLPIAVSDSDPLEDTYCHLVATGALPELIQDAADIPRAAAMPVTQALPVGAHLSAPIRLSDGRIYGTFCCFSYKADHSLNERDINLLKLFADVAGQVISEELNAEKVRTDRVSRIEQVIAIHEFCVVYQPIFALSDDSLVGFEALTRFLGEPLRTTDRWFAEAAEVDLTADLELATAQDACHLLLTLNPALSLALNFSPSSVFDPRFKALFNQMPVHRLILEITEHAAVENYEQLEQALAPLRKRGLRLAVDDAGAGQSSFKHVLDLRPDLIKLDMSLTKNINRDPARLALAEALTRFGRAMGSQIVAEGVETELELNTLRSIGVTKVLGYFVGRPMSLKEAASLPMGLAEKNQGTI